MILPTVNQSKVKRKLVYLSSHILVALQVCQRVTVDVPKVVEKIHLI